MTTHEGNLHIYLRRGTEKVWSRRFFKMEGSQLTYSRPNGTESYTIVLESATAHPDDRRPEKFQFEIKSGGRSYFLRADNEKEMMDWIGSINPPASSTGGDPGAVTTSAPPVDEFAATTAAATTTDPGAMPMGDAGAMPMSTDPGAMPMGDAGAMPMTGDPGAAPTGDAAWTTDPAAGGAAPMGDAGAAPAATGGYQDDFSAPPAH